MPTSGNIIIAVYYMGTVLVDSAQIFLSISNNARL